MRPATLAMTVMGLVASVLPASTAAQDAADSDRRARELFEAGRDAFDAGDFETALSLFEDAYANSPRPALLYNIAASADRLRRDEMAADYYRRYLAAEPDAAERTNVEARIAAIERAQADRAPSTTELSDDRSIFGEWWFWAVAAVVVGAAVAVSVVVATSDGREPVMGEGGIVFTLSGP